MATNPFDYLNPSNQPTPIPPLPVNGGLLGQIVGTATMPQPPQNIPPAIGFENDSAAQRVTAMTSSGSDYIKGAEAAGLAVANRRGLLNSSIAAGASRGAAIDRAQPFALADAQSAAGRNQIRLDAGFQAQRQAGELASREKLTADTIAAESARLGRQLTSNELIAAQNDATNRFQAQLQSATQTNIAGMDIVSREKIAANAIASEELRLGRQLTSNEKIAAINDATNRYQADLQARTQLAISEREIASRQALQTQAIASEEARLGRQLTSQEQLAQLQATTQTNLANLDIRSRETLATQSITAEQQRLNQTIAAEELRLGRQLTSSERTAAATDATNRYQVDLQAQTQQRAIASEEARLGRQLTSQEAQAAIERASRLEVANAGSAADLERSRIAETGANSRANLDAATRTQISYSEGLNANQRAQLAYYQSVNSDYSRSLDNLYANKDIPAAARGDALNQFFALRTANIDVARATLGTNMSWGSTGGSTTYALPGGPVMSGPPPAGVLLPGAPPASYAQGGLLFGGDGTSFGTDNFAQRANG